MSPEVVTRKTTKPHRRNDEALRCDAGIDYSLTPVPSSSGSFRDSYLFSSLSLSGEEWIDFRHCKIIGGMEPPTPMLPSSLTVIPV